MNGIIFNYGGGGALPDLKTHANNLLQVNPAEDNVQWANVPVLPDPAGHQNQFLQVSPFGQGLIWNAPNIITYAFRNAKTVFLQTTPSGIVIDSVNGKYYVGDFSGKQIFVYDLFSDSVLNTISLGVFGNATDRVGSLTIEGEVIYVAFGSMILKLDLTTLAISQVNKVSPLTLSVYYCVKNKNNNDILFTDKQNGFCKIDETTGNVTVIDSSIYVVNQFSDPETRFPGGLRIDYRFNRIFVSKINGFFPPSFNEYDLATYNFKANYPAGSSLVRDFLIDYPLNKLMVLSEGGNQGFENSLDMMRLDFLIDNSEGVAYHPTLQSAFAIDIVFFENRKNRIYVTNHRIKTISIYVEEVNLFNPH